MMADLGLKTRLIIRIFKNTLQVQSATQYKYLHRCVADYAREIQNQNNTGDEYLLSDCNQNADYILKD